MKNKIIEEIILKNKDAIIERFFKELFNGLPYKEDSYFYQHSDSSTEVMMNKINDIGVEYDYRRKTKQFRISIFK